MVKTILLHLDEEIFKKLKAHKIKLESQNKCILSWEDYVIELFGLGK